MRSALQRTAFGFLDIADQPDSSYVLMAETPFGSMAFAVDKVEATEYGTIGYRSGKQVCLFTPHVPVAVLARENVLMVTREDSIRKQQDDMNAELKLRAELDPEAGEVAFGVKELNVRQVREALRRTGDTSGPFGDGAYR